MTITKERIEEIKQNPTVSFTVSETVEICALALAGLRQNTWTPDVSIPPPIEPNKTPDMASGVHHAVPKH